MDDRRAPWLTEQRLLAFSGTVFLACVAVFIAIPILVTLAMSFNKAAAIRFPIREWSPGWYLEFAASPQWTDALKNSLIIASGTMVVATIAGTAAAWAFDRYQFRFKVSIYLLIMLPLFLPGVVLGLGIAITFNDLSFFGFQIYGSRLVVILAHSIWATPLVFMVMESVFRSVNAELIDASSDLGAGPARTFVEVVMPIVRTGILASALFAFVVSLNEFMMALFLTTRDTQTLPVLMWLSLRSAATPNLAVAAVLLSGTVFAGIGLVAAVAATSRKFHLARGGNF